MAVAAMPSAAPECLDEVNKGSSSTIAANGGSNGPVINPIAAYSQQLASKQMHIARVNSEDVGGVHWRRTEAAEAQDPTRDRDFFKDRILSKLNKPSTTAMSGGMLDRELGLGDQPAATLPANGHHHLHLMNGSAQHAYPSCTAADKGPASLQPTLTARSALQPPADSTKSKPKANGGPAAPTVPLLLNLAQTQSRPSLSDSSNNSSGLDTFSTSSRSSSEYATPGAFVSTPNALGFEGQPQAGPSDRSATRVHDFESTNKTSNGGEDGLNLAVYHSEIPLPSSRPSTRASDDPKLNNGGISQAQSSGTEPSTTEQPEEQPVLFVKNSPTLLRQQQDKKTPPPLSGLPYLPQANVIPPTPPTASTSASFAQPAAASADAAQQLENESTPTQPISRSPQTPLPASPKSIYLSPDSLRKSPPSHKRSVSYSSAPVIPRASTSTSSHLAPLTPTTPAATNSGLPPRRSSLLPPITTSSIIAAGTDIAALKKRSLSPRRALSFRGSGSNTTLPGSGTIYDEPLSLEEQAVERRNADELEETIARQADQIRKERLSKRIETQRQHEKNLLALREEKEMRVGRGEDTGASALQSGSPPTREGVLAGPKGKERERGDTSSTTAGQTSPTSPVSVHKQLWASSPVAGEHAGVRSPAIGDHAINEKTGAPKEGHDPFAAPERVLVGNLIGEDHVNYVLMYNMLTGIRIGVSRCEAKINRPLTDEDYKAQHKFSFDIVGNELTPSARYDFKFKDYAPWVFRELRAHFLLDPADYLLSLTAKYILSELGSPGKSGSFFYFSRDYRFIIKTISHTEHKFLRRILKQYHTHVLDNPNTLISRFYGLHRVKLPHGRKIHFVIMNNLFPPHRDIHETFDLKGSSIGREYPEEKLAEKPRATLKDLNWVRRDRHIEFGPYKRHAFEEQLQRDVVLLQRLKIMDYSLLLGVHDMGRGNSENLRDGMLTVFQPEGGKLRRRLTQRGDLEREHNAAELRKAVQRADPQVINTGAQLPSKEQSERRHFVFYQDEGGIRATNELDQNLNTIYYLGVIDILTPYNWKKKIEHFWRSMQYDKHRISAVPPKEYADRFLGFLNSVMRGGDQSRKPKME